MPGGVKAGEVYLDLSINKKDYNNQLNGIERAAHGIASKLKAAFAVGSIAAFGKKCLELGSDLQEVQNVVDVTYRTMSESVNQFARDAMTSYGLSETMAKRYAGTFGAMAKAFGFTERQAYEMSTTLTGLAGDVASFYNISQDEAYTKLKAVFSGETEVLKDLGIVMTQTALDQYALANGFGKTTSAMSEMEKVSLRYAFVQSQLSAATGDFARTQNSWANQSRILALQAQSAMAAVGQGLINLLTPAIKAINAVMSKVVRLAQMFRDFTASIFGDASGGGISAGGGETIVGKMADDLSSATGAASKLGGAATGAGSGLKAASRSAKELKRTLEGFDQVIKVTDNSKNSSGASGGTGTGGTGSGGGAAAAGAAMSDTAETAEQSTSKLSAATQKLLEPAIRAWGRLAQSFGRFADTVKSAGVWIVNKVLIPIGKWTISKAVPAVFDLLAAVFDLLNEACKALAPTIQWLYDNILVPLGKWTGALIIGAIKLVTGALKGLTDWIRNNQEWFSTIVLAIGSFAGAFVGITKIVGVITRVIGAVKSFVTAFKTLKTAFSMASSIGALLKGLFIANPFGLIVVAISAAIAAGVLLYKNWDKVKAAVGRLKKAFMDFLKRLKNDFKNIPQYFAKPFETAKKRIQETFERIGDWFGDRYKDICDAFSGIKEFFAETFSNALSRLSECIPDLSDIAQKVSEKIGEITATVTGAVETAKDWWSDVKSGISEKIGEIQKTVSAVKDAAFDTVVEAWNTIQDSEAYKTITAAKDAAFDKAHEAWETIKDKVSTFTAQAGTAAATIKDWWTDRAEQWKDKTSSFANSFRHSVSDIAGGFSRRAAQWKNKTSSFANSFKHSVQNIKNGWASRANAWKNKTAEFGIKIKGTVNDIKSWFNRNVIAKVNSAIHKIPLLRSVSIPYLAQGGYVQKNTPQLAMIGDNRHQGEVVAPEDKLAEMARQAAAGAGGYDPRVVQLLEEILVLLRTMDIVALDPESLRKYFVKKTNQNTKSTGKCELLV